MTRINVALLEISFIGYGTKKMMLEGSKGGEKLISSGKETGHL